MTSPTVRRIAPAEYAEVGELTARVYLDEGYGSASYAPVLRDVAGRDRDAVVLVALVDARIVGAVTLADGGGPWAERASAGEAEMRMLAVQPQARGAGAGEALVRSCLDLARERGRTVLRLSTEPTMHAAHRLYERLGFRRTPEQDWEVVPGLVLLGYCLELSGPRPA